MQDLDSQLFGESVLEELFVGSTSSGGKEMANKMLEKLGLEELNKQHPQCLSGGQKQRLVLGAALMRNTQLLILDEPTSGLDGQNMLRVAKLIRGLAEEGHAVIMITHDYELIMHACDRMVQIENGCLKNDELLSEKQDVLQMMLPATARN